MGDGLNCAVLPLDKDEFILDRDNKSLKFEVASNNDFDVKVRLRVSKQGIIAFDRPELTLKKGVSAITISAVKNITESVSIRIDFEGNEQRYSVRKVVKLNFEESDNSKSNESEEKTRETITIRSILLLPLIVACIFIYCLELMSNTPVIGYLYNPLIIFVVGWITSFVQFKLHIYSLAKTV